MEKKNIILGNAFSLQMLTVADDGMNVNIIPIDIDGVSDLISYGFTSSIGHLDTATVVSNILGVDVPQNRINIALTSDDVLIVAQFMGGRLPEGATSLPKEMDIKFFAVSIKN